VPVKRLAHYLPDALAGVKQKEPWYDYHLAPTIFLLHTSSVRNRAMLGAIGGLPTTERSMRARSLSSHLILGDSHKEVSRFRFRFMFQLIGVIVLESTKQMFSQFKSSLSQWHCQVHLFFLVNTAHTCSWHQCKEATLGGRA
jgi:hypothetical protein